jgi:hypothetical protein
VITLTFRPLGSESVILVRGAYFRICADGTLRGPDNAVTASCTGEFWQLGRRQQCLLECREAVYLRVTTSDGQRECIGRYECLKVTGGAIFSNDTYLGAHPCAGAYIPTTGMWTEVALLSRL